MSILTQQRKRVKVTQEKINSFNKPWQTAVAINCAHIGDDNDYSCHLSSLIKKMIKAGLSQEAYTLWLTDPLLSREGGVTPSYEQFQHHFKEVYNVEN